MFCQCGQFLEGQVIAFASGFDPLPDCCAQAGHGEQSMAKGNAGVTRRCVEKIGAAWLHFIHGACINGGWTMH